MMGRSRVIGGVTALLLQAGSASALTVALNPGFWSTDVQVRAEHGPANEVIRNPDALPFLASESVVEGAAAAGATFDLSNAGFEIRFGLARPGGGTFGRGESLAHVYFSVDEEVAYAIDGSFGAIDPDGADAIFVVELIEIRGVASDTLFFSRQESTHTPDQSFVVGGAGGDSVNELLGSAAGTLLPGREYQFFFHALLGAQQAPSQPGTASGSARITFVPEPATGLLLAVGGLVLARRLAPRTRAAGARRDSRGAPG
jgi:hypothetical protein